MYRVLCVVFLFVACCSTASVRPFVPITQEELAQKICQAIKKNAWTAAPNCVGQVLANYQDWRELKRITPLVRYDLSRVRFGNENIDCIDSNGENPDLVMGFHTLESGLTFLGAVGGDDSEIAVLFLLYWDGSRLRGYIPTHGNPWNTDTRKAYVWGNQLDAVNCVKRFGKQVGNVTFDGLLIEEEINAAFAEADNGQVGN